MPALEAKSKRKIRHDRAIEKFKQWVKENPKASDEQKYEAFDRLVDGRSA